MYIKNKIILFVFLFLMINCAIAKSTISPHPDEIENRIYTLEHKVKIIDANQLNYKIEKDLLKEAYSSNYEKINIFITFILGVIAVLGYLGIKDIGAIKEKYETELAGLKEIKNDFDIKSSEFDAGKQKIDEEIKSILKENQEQSSKIKFIELKEKMYNLFTNRKLSMALEFANAALVINPSDSSCLNTKGSILIQLNQLPDAFLAFEKSLNDNPDDLATKVNYAECLYLTGKIDDARKFVAENNDIFDKELDGKLVEFFEILVHYHEGNLDRLKGIAKSYVNFSSLDDVNKKLKGWTLTDARSFAYYLEDGEIKTTIQNLFWYLNGEISGRTLLGRLGISLPASEEDKVDDA